jgi:hypothetical protein
MRGATKSDDDPSMLDGIIWVIQLCSKRADFTVGVMSLSDGPRGRGKCSLKMLQHMAADRPCVVSPMGMSREILDQARAWIAGTQPCVP